MKRLPIPKYARTLARSALERRSRLPKSKRFGLDERQASSAGVYSGVKRARNIISKRSLSMREAKRVAAFGRFLNKTGPRAQGAIDLWGGRRFIKKARAFVRKY